MPFRCCPCGFITVKNMFCFIPLKPASVLIAAIAIVSTVVDLIVGFAFFNPAELNFFFILWVVLDAILATGGILFLMGLFVCKKRKRLFCSTFMWIILGVMSCGVSYLIVVTIMDIIDGNPFAAIPFVMHVISTVVWFYFFIVIYSFRKFEIDKAGRTGTSGTPTGSIKTTMSRAPSPKTKPKPNSVK